MGGARGAKAAEAPASPGGKRRILCAGAAGSSGATPDGSETPSRKRLRGKTQHEQCPRPQWVPVLEQALRLTKAENEWLRKQVGPEGELNAAAFTERRNRVYGLGIVPEWVTETTQLRFGPLPAIDGEEGGAWFLQPDGLDRAAASSAYAGKPTPLAAAFQRVRVAWDDDAGLQATPTDIAGDPRSGSAATARLVAEWSPALALQHAAQRLSLPAASVRLRWCCSPRSAAVRPLDQEEEPEFQLRGCIGEQLAAQPPRFRRYSLRADQLRSLRYMLDREAKPVRFTTEVRACWAPGVRWEDQPRHHEWSNWCNGGPGAVGRDDLWKGIEERSGFSWCYDTRMEATFPVAGGVLGDPIGSGKTATLIGLLDAQRKEHIQHPVPPVDVGHFIPSRATLLLVPSNLVAQWEGEIQKFLGEEAFRLLVIRSATDLRRLTVKDIVESEVVLATYKILYSGEYVERLRSLQCTRSNCLHERSFYGQPIERTLEQVRLATRDVLTKGAEEVGWTLRTRSHEERQAAAETGRTDESPLSKQEVAQRLSTLGVCKDWRELPRPVFEIFYWQRIVFDEFHELEAMDRRRCTMLSYLRAHCRWGLTGTPPTRDMVQIAELAQILRVQITDYSTPECQQFLDTFVRQNAADLPEIPVEEHMVLVRQTLEERAIYLQRVYDGKRRDLLQFCSHHCLEGNRGGLEDADWEAAGATISAGSSAGATVARLGERKCEKQKELQAQFEAERIVLVVLAHGLHGLHNAQESKAEAEAAARLRAVEADLRSVEDNELQAFLSRRPVVDGEDKAGLEGLAESAVKAVDIKRPGGAACRQVLRAIGNGNKPQLAALRAAHAAQLGRCATAAGKLLTAARSLRFLRATLRALGEASGADEQPAQRPDCPVCLEATAPEEAAVLPCAHVFHRHCILRVAAAAGASPACPTCRAPFRRCELAGLPQAADASVEPGGELVERFGSKLAAVGSTLQRIRTEHPGAKAIVFVQWRELERLVGEALEGMGIAHVRLRGPAAQRGRLITEFQEKPEPSVLLQSLENSASGANLTRASHVLLVHPMDAESPSKAVAYETQALGRVRRCGQQAPKVHLWRFVTCGTVEEEISEEHRRGFSGALAAAGGDRSS